MVSAYSLIDWCEGVVTARVSALATATCWGLCTLFVILKGHYDMELFEVHSAFMMTNKPCDVCVCVCVCACMCVHVFLYVVPVCTHVFVCGVGVFCSS